MKGLSGFAWIIIILIVLYLVNPSIFPFAVKPTTTTPTTKTCPDGSVIASTATCPGTTPSVTCPSTMQTTIKTALKNPLAGTLSYTQANLTIVDADSGEVKSISDFAAGGATKGYSTGVALSCGKHYKIYTWPNTNTSTNGNFTSCSKDLGIIDGDTAYIDFECSNATLPEFAVFTSSYANQSGNKNNDYWVTDVASTDAQAMGTNSVLTMILRYRANSTYSGGSQFGSDELSTYVCADYEMTAFSKSGVTTDRTDWVETDLPKWCANAGYDKAWKIPALKTSHGDRDAKITLKADLGNPSTDPRFYFVDEAYYQGSDGKMHYSSANDAGTDLGMTNKYVDINLS